MSRARLLQALREGLPLVLLLLALCARSLSLSTAHLVPLYDEVAYMAEAHAVAARGETGTVACYLRGACRDDNRTPLYLMLVAPALEGGPGDFALAKLVTLATAVLLVLVVYGLGRGLWGPGAALAAAAVPALSWDAAMLSQSVLADVLYAALFFAALAALARGHGRRAGWLAFGLLAGLAYLAKASGHFLLLSAAAVAAYRARRREEWAAPLGLALAGFAAGAGLVLWRNVLVWGSPLHNMNTRIMWLDSYSQWWLLEARPEGWSKIGALAYLRHHSLLEIADRLLEGFRAVSTALLSVLDAWPFSPGSAFTGPLLAAAACWGLRLRWREGRREEVVAACAVLGPLLLAHFWGYSVGVKGVRFMLPVAVVLAPYAALAARQAWRALWLRSGFPALWRARALSALFCAAGAVALAGAAEGLAVDPAALWTVPPHWQDAADWIEAHVVPGRLATSSETFFSAWDMPRDTVFACPFDLFDEQLRQCIDGHRADYLLVDRQDHTFDQWPGRLGPFDAFGPTTFLGWPRVYHDPLRPSQLLIYKRPNLNRGVRHPY